MKEASHLVDGLLPRVDLSSAQREEMYALLKCHFHGVTRDQFEQDLAEKNWVVQIRREDRLLGFTTLLAVDEQFAGCSLTAIYSGDTIVSPEGWGSPALARTWIAAVNCLRNESPGTPCYWLLLTSGFRTYRFLPVFWRHFFPHHAVATPPRDQLLLHHLAAARYGRYYDAAQGIVRFPRPQMLRGPLGDVPVGRASDAHIAFFLERNPGHAGGDELACLAEISDDNLTRAGRRMVT